MGVPPRDRATGDGSAHSGATVRIGGRIPNHQLTALEFFRTARWRDVQPGSKVMVARVAHSPWPFHRAEVVALADDLVAAGGYPQPDGEPRVLYSTRVSLLAGRLERA